MIMYFFTQSITKGSVQVFFKKVMMPCTNMKDELDCAGDKIQDGLEYKFNPFTPQEIKQHI